MNDFVHRVNNHEHSSKKTLNDEDDRMTVLESQLSAKFSPISQLSAISQLKCYYDEILMFITKNHLYQLIKEDCNLIEMKIFTPQTAKIWP